MDEKTHAIAWEAPEHHHIEKTSDWFWALSIVAAAAAITALVLGNVLFSIVIILGAATMLVFAQRTPRIIQYAVTARGIRANNELFPYTSLVSFYIDEDHVHGPHLLAKTGLTFNSLIIIPIPPEYIEEIDDLLSARVPEEHLEEPLAHRLLEFFGF